MRTTCITLTALFILAVGGRPVTAAEPVKITDPKDRKIVEGFLKNADKIVGHVSRKACKDMLTQNTERYTWLILPRLAVMPTAYRVSGDPKYLDHFITMVENMRSAMTKDKQGFLGWYGVPEPGYGDTKIKDFQVDYAINAFRFVENLALFIEDIRKEPALARKYARQEKEYLDLCENHLVKKWLARGWFTDLGSTGAVMRGHPQQRPDRKFLTKPHNKHSIITHGLLALYRVTGKDTYMKMAVKLGVRFKHCLTLHGDHYRWNYWDPSGDWDIHPDNRNKWKHWIGYEHKGGYWSMSLSHAVDLYHHGVVFDRADMDRFLKAQLNWKGLSKDGYVCSALAPWDGRIEKVLFTGAPQEVRLQKAGNWWHGGVVANHWLEQKYVYLPAARGGKQIHLEHGKKFLSKKENREWLATLNFTVKGRGYTPPRTPSAMKNMPTASRK